MKKRFYLLGMLAVGLTFAGCTDDIDDATGSGVASGDKGYVKIAINLPTTSGQVTRAAADGTGENDDFEKGEDGEYAVNNAIIALFKATKSEGVADETTATFVTARGIELSNQTEQNGNVQYRYEYTLDAVPMVEDNEQMYALAILNNNGLFSVSSGDLKYGETVVTSYSDLARLAITEKTNANDFINNGFLMLNAPISDIASVASSTSTAFNPKVTILASVRVHEEDPSEMDNIAADPIYVERAVAKVEVSVNGNGTNAEDNDDGTVSLPVTGADGHSIKFTRWALNVTNKSSYILRHVNNYANWATYYNAKAEGGTAALNRFFGSTANPYRVYWAVDNNYSSNTAGDFNQFNDATPNWKAMLNVTGDTHTTNVDYCFENTMAANQQIQGFTTGVLLEGKYAINGKTDVDLFTLGSSSAVYDETKMLEFINATLGKTGDDQYIFDESSLQGGITIDTEDEFTKYFKTMNGGIAMTSEDAKKLMADQSVAQINYYQTGKTYYWTRPIKHFGDYYTPIYKNGLPADYYDDARDYNDNDHLGRYGVVRNNWYELNITSVSGPGYPEIPEIPTEPENPDDPGEGYVKMEINILSWAKRQQNVDL